MNQRQRNFLTVLADRRIIEDGDLGNLIKGTLGWDKRTATSAFNFLMERKLIEHLGERKYRVNTKQIRRMLDEQ